MKVIDNAIGKPRPREQLILGLCLTLLGLETFKPARAANEASAPGTACSTRRSCASAVSTPGLLPCLAGKPASRQGVSRSA
nr:hypothetical protein [Pseudomonas sp. BIGb0427]